MADSTSALNFAPRPFPTALHLSLNEARREQALKSGATEYTFKNVSARAGAGRLEAWVEGNELEPACSMPSVRRLDN